MRVFTTILEIVILTIVAWMVFPKLIFGMEFTHILPGIRFTSNLSLKHLLQLAVLIFIYAAMFINSGPGFLGASLSRLSPVVKTLALFILVFGVYLHVIPGHTGDNIPSKLIPISIVEEGNIDLDEFRYAIYRGHYYCMTKQNDHYYSTYPVYPGITVVPFYAAVKLIFPEKFDQWRQEYSQRNGDLLNGFAQSMHHYSASLIASLAIVFFWLIANRLAVPAIISVPTTIAFAFGTPMMSSMAASIWTHSPSILFMLMAIFFSASRDENEQTNTGLLLGGLCAAWAIACRPTGLVAGGFLALYVLLKCRKRAVFFLIPLLLLLTVVTFLNLQMYDKIFGGYQGQVNHFAIPTVQRIFYLLMSPSRGLLTFVPCVILLIFFIPRISQKKVDLLTLSLLAAAGEVGIYSCWSVWWGGNCFGPRLLADCIMWCLLGIVAANRYSLPPQHLMAKMGWLGSIFLVAYSVCLHTTGAIYGDKNWDRDYLKRHQEALMHWKKSSIMWTLTDIRNNPNND